MNTPDADEMKLRTTTADSFAPIRYTRTLLLIQIAIGAPLTLMPFYVIDGWFGVAISVFALLCVILLNRMGLTAKLWNSSRRISNNQKLSIIIVGLVAFGTSMIQSWYLPPLENIVDESAYIHGAETFTSGRLTNVTHPLWEHFEAFNIMSSPTTSSKHPPAQSLFLAAGKIIAGHYIAGVWGSFALACASFCWMLQAWTTRRWAFMGGLIAATHPFLHGGMFIQISDVWQAFIGNFPYPSPNYVWSWSQSFWGGAVAMLGGCLLYGTLPRISGRYSLRDAITLGFGVLILANSRPFEGLVVCLPAGVYFARGLFRAYMSGHIRQTVVCFMLPSLIIIFSGILAMACFNNAVTGSPFRMPYQVYSAQYDSAPMFVFQKPFPRIDYRHQDFQNVMDWHLNIHHLQQSFRGWLKNRDNYTFAPLGFFVGPMSLALLWLPAALKSKPVRVAFISVLFLLVIHQSVIATVPHYIAPGACLILLVITSCVRQLSLVRIGDFRIGRLSVLYLMILLPVCLMLITTKRDHSVSSKKRHEIKSSLEAMGGQHLVVIRTDATVRKNPSEGIAFGWIYNHPDIDESKVIWARDLGEEKNRKLLDYYKDRRVWWLSEELDLRSIPE